MSLRNLTIFSFIILMAAAVSAAVPTINSFEIEGGAAFTNDAVLSLAMTADGEPTDMNFSCDNTNWTVSETYADSKDFDLDSAEAGDAGCDSADDVKNIYIWVKNIDGDDTATDDITLDATGPEIDNESPLDGSETDNNMIVVTVKIVDDLNEVDVSSIVMNVGGADYDTGDTELVFAPDTLTFTPIEEFADGTIDVTVDANDLLENSANTSWSFKVDTRPPSITITAPIDGGELEDNRLIEFGITDATSGVDKSEIAVDLNGVTSGSFRWDDDCVCTSGNCQCSYEEGGLDSNGTIYTITIDAKDKAGHSAETATSTFTYYDNPPAAPQSLAADAGDEEVGLTWNPNTEADMNKYMVNRGTIADFNITGETYLATVLHSACETNCSYTDTDLNNDTTYYYKIFAVDKSDNFSDISSEVSGTPEEAPLDKPTISSDSHSSESTWYDKDDIELEWTSVAEATKYKYKLDKVSNTDPSTVMDPPLDREKDYSNKADGTWYFHVKACNGGGVCGTPDHFKIRIDTTDPDEPDDFDAEKTSSTKVKLTWSEVDDESGIDDYVLYRGTSSGFTPSSSNKVDTISGSTERYTDTDLSSTRKYYYKLKAVDNAGNTSGYASTSINMSGSGNGDDDDDDDCDLTITINVPDYVKAGSTTIEISSGSKNMTDSTLKVKLYGKSYTSSFDSYHKTSSVTSFSNTYTFEVGDDGTATVWVLTDDSGGDECSKTVTFIVDTNAPKVTWVEPAADSTLTGTTSLKVKAVDLTSVGDTASGIKKVTFYYGTTEIGSVTSDTNDQYILDWDLNGVTAGTYALKAVAEDRAGNTAEALVSITLQPLSAEATVALNALNWANANKVLAETKIADLQNQSIFVSSTVTTAKENADQMLAEAQDHYDSSSFASAKTKAESANTAYEDIKDHLSTTAGQSDSYEFDKSNLEALFSATGLNANLIEEAVSYGQNNAVTRQLKVSKVTDSTGIPYYTSSITITYKNETSSNQSIQLIEAIPKTFAASASDIISSTPFEIIEDDPIIKFDLGMVNAGQTVTVTYGLNKSLSLAAAEGMVAASVVGQFKSPPIVLNSSTAFDEDSIASTSTYDYGSLMTIIIVVFVLALLIILGGGYLVYVSHVNKPIKKRRFEFMKQEEKSFGGFLQETFGDKKGKNGLDKFN